MQIWIFLKQKQICIFLRCRFEFFLNKKWICIFIKCRSKFFLNKKWICIFIRCRSKFFSNQKRICIFLRYRYDFSLTYVDFETKEKIKHDCVYGCFVLFGSYSINLCYEWNSLHKKKKIYIFFNKTYKNISDFFCYQKPFFFSSQNRSDLLQT